MNHVLGPRNPIHKAIDIPYIGGVKYDGLDFKTYPHRQGWHDQTASQWSDLFARPSTAFQSFLQSWLFFGLISETLTFMDGTRLDESNLTRVEENSSRILVDTSKLSSLFDKWVTQEHPRLWSDKTRLDSFGNTLSHAVVIVACLERNAIGSLGHGLEATKLSLEAYIGSTGVRNPLDPRVNLSINLLLELLYPLVTVRPFLHYDTLKSFPVFKEPRLGRWDSLVTRRMRQDGWCPYQISMLQERFNAFALYYVSNFSRPSSSREHAMIRIHKQPSKTQKSGMRDANAESHLTQDLCTEFKCALTQLKPDEYEPQHVHGCLGCHNVLANMAEMCSILKEGSFPLIVSIDDDDNQPEITFVSADDDVEYVAISHVWSDGLGNVKENALPKCQLQRLSKFVRTLPGNASDIILFWLDTLCVPRSVGLDDIASKEAKSMAIVRMRDTYKQARAVLVLDSWLLTHRIESLSNAEVLLRILGSNWNSRLWTLQEGALAQQLIFQFADKPYELDHGIKSLLNERSAMLDWTLKGTIVQRVQDFRGFQKDGSTSAKVIALAHTMKIRSTSVSSDEAICLATLLDIDVLKVNNTSKAERMLTFWSLLKSLPAALIFYTGPKFHVNGYRWAPKSLLRGSKEQHLNLPVYHDREEAIRTDDGLLVKYPGFIFCAPRQPLNRVFWIFDSMKNWYRVYIPNQDSVDPWALNRDTGIFAPNIQTSIRIDPLVIITNRTMSPAAHAISGILALPADNIDGWIKMTSEGIQARHVYSICRVNLQLEDSESLHIKRMAASVGISHIPPPISSDVAARGFLENELGGLKAVFTLRIPDTETWCVD